jgi:RNA polymerase sigma-32 factor
MKSDDSAELDPEVLADPLEDEDASPSPGETPAKRGSRRAEPDGDEHGATKLVPAGETSLVPADPFRRYLYEVRKYPPLSREEERELARRYRDTGDRRALFRLVTANLMLVVRVAFSFRRAAHNLLDLVQEGNLGLLAAIDRFDPELGVRLPTYAAWWVRAYMVKFLLDNVRLVRVGTTNARRKLLRNLRKEKRKLESQGFEVGPKLLAEHFGVSEQDVTDVQAALDSRDVSLDEPLRSDPDRVRGDLLPDGARPNVEETVARSQLQEQAEAAIAEFRRGLNERELTLLDRRILSDDPLTLQALGDRFGTSREAVRQSEARLMSKLKEFLREHLGELGQIQIGPD